MANGRGYKRTPRFTKRLEAAFSSGGLSYRGILSNVSTSGLFIRTNRGFAPGTTLDIELMLPCNRVSTVKGIVRRTIKTPVTTEKNGMGVELTSKDEEFEKFIGLFLEEADQDATQESETAQFRSEPDKPPEPQFKIISCTGCGVKNKIPAEKMSLNPKCGKCGAPLPVFNR